MVHKFQVLSSVPSYLHMDDSRVICLTMLPKVFLEQKWLNILACALHVLFILIKFCFNPFVFECVIKCFFSLFL